MFESVSVGIDQFIHVTEIDIPSDHDVNQRSLINRAGWRNVNTVFQCFSCQLLCGFLRIFLRDMIVVAVGTVLAVTEGIAGVADHADHESTAEAPPKMIFHISSMAALA